MFNLKNRSHFASMSFQNLTSDANQTFHERLSYFLEDNGVSSQCQRDLIHVNSGLEMGVDWALRMVDAFGKPGADLMGLRFSWMGSYDECVEIEEIVDENNEINGQFCWVNFPFNKSLLPHSSKYILVRDSVPMEFRIGTCFPEKCSEKDIKSVVRAVSGQIGMVNSPSELDVRCHSSTGLSSGAIVCLVVLFVLALLLTTGTVYDVIVMRLLLVPNNRHMSNHTDNQPAEMVYLNGNECQHVTELEMKEAEFNGKGRECNKLTTYDTSTAPIESESYLHEFCMAFSIIKNGEEMLYIKESKTTINALEGMKVLTLSWIVMLHIFSYSKRNVSLNLDLYAINKFGEDWTLLGVVNSHSVDTFFVISGFLLAYTMFRKLKQSGGARKFKWGFFYLFRFWRLSPTYYIVFLVYWKFIFGGYFTGPLWANAEMVGSAYAEDCHLVWWKLLLYVQNFADDKGCFTPTWFLAADMQMYAFSPFLLVPLFSFPKLGLFIASVCIAGSIIYTVTVSWVNEFLPTYSYLGVDGNAKAYWNLIHFYPFSHISSFVIGIITAYILYKWRDTIILSRKKNLIGWAVAIGTCIAIAYLPFRGYDKHDFVDPEYLASWAGYQFYYAIYEGLVRSLWSCSICWMIVSCATGHGGFVNTLLGWKPFVVLGRLTYSTYLVHEIVLLVYFLSRHTLYYFSDIEWSFAVVAITTMSYGAGFILSVCLEMPFSNLRKLFVKGNV